MSRQSVVFIDPDTEWTKQLHRAFWDSGLFNVDSPYADGDKGFKAILNMRPDIIVMEMLVPNKDGAYIINHISSALPVYHPMFYIISHANMKNLATYFNKYLPPSARVYTAMKPQDAKTVVENTIWLQAARLNGLALQKGDEGTIYSDIIVQRLDKSIEEFLTQLGYKPQLKRSLTVKLTLRYLLLENPTALNISDVSKYVTQQVGCTYAAVERNLRSFIQDVFEADTAVFREEFDGVRRGNKSFYWRAYCILKERVSSDIWKKEAPAPTESAQGGTC